MVRSKFLPVATLVLALVSSACASGRAEPVLFSDNFSNSASGWDQIQNEVGTAGYEQGSFRIFINDTNDFLIAGLSQDLGNDVSVEVNAHKAGGPDDNYYGVVCHYQDPDNYYLLLVSSSGRSAIAMMLEGEFGLISPGLQPLVMEGIKLGAATNRIRADCVGDQMTLYANGRQVSLAYDHHLTGGKVGLVAASGQVVGGVDIRFDNFRVYQP
jgi:hypothetical protein